VKRTLDPFAELRQTAAMNFSERSVMVLAPHPDDDVIACGGTLCAYHAAGARTQCVYVTDGRKGNPAIEENQLVERRREEAAESSRIMGVTRTVFLSNHDSALAITKQSTSELRRYLLEERPDAVFVPAFFDRHPDHAGTCRLFVASSDGLDALTCYLYSFWTPLPFSNAVADVTAHMPTKQMALAAHASPLKMGHITDAMAGLARYHALLAGMEGFCEPFIRCSRAELWRWERAAAH